VDLISSYYEMRDVEKLFHKRIKFFNKFGSGKIARCFEKLRSKLYPNLTFTNTFHPRIKLLNTPL